MLKSGMSEGEVFRILGMVSNTPVALCAGPPNRYGSQYLFRTNYSLCLTFDETRDAFLFARLDGDGWTNVIESIAEP